LLVLSVVDAADAADRDNGGSCNADGIASADPFAAVRIKMEAEALADMPKAKVQAVKRQR
jgi:hypothetical protein